MADNDPFRSYNFKLNISGVNDAHFTECSGLGLTVEPIRYREAGDSYVVRHIPGPVTFEPVTLTYGVTNSNDLWRWLMTAVDGRVERKNVSIIMMSADGSSEVMRWNLQDAWPSAWKGTTLDAMANEIAIESLTLVYDSLGRDR